MQQAPHTPLARAVRDGLTQTPKRLPSWLLYDAEGSRLFTQIMNLPEYYLTRAEFEILANDPAGYAALFSPGGAPFELLELGPGDGRKTNVLLRHFVETGLPFRYRPVDISAEALQHLTGELRRQWPRLDVQPLHDDFFRALDGLAPSPLRKVVLFLGSSVGNFTEEQLNNFYRQLWQRLRPGDLVLTGFDLQKHPAVIRAAYNDAAGLTRAFNLNLLRRLNTELQATFDLAAWDHYECYDPETGEARSYLVSRKPQTVGLGRLDLEVHFPYADLIHTETSRKFRPEDIRTLAAAAGFTIADWQTDCRAYFADVVFRK